MASKKKSGGVSDSTPPESSDSTSQAAELPSDSPTEAGAELSADQPTVEPSAEAPIDQKHESDGDSDETLTVDSNARVADDEEDRVSSTPVREETFTESVYERTPTGHRVIRRTVTLKRTEEHIDEEIEEDFFPSAGHQAPLSTCHPAPVG